MAVCLSGVTRGLAGDVNLDDFTNAIIAMAAVAGAPKELAVRESKVFAAIIRKGKGGGSVVTDDCQLEEGTMLSITSPFYDAEIAQWSQCTVDVHGRSEKRWAIGRYHLLQAAATFSKTTNKGTEKAEILCSLLRHIEDMHSKKSKLVRRRDLQQPCQKLASAIERDRERDRETERETEIERQRDRERNDSIRYNAPT